MSPRSLKFKVSLYLILVLAGVMGLFVALLVKQEREEQLRTLVTHMAQLSQVIERSTRHAMLLDQPDIVDKIIEDVGKQEGIRRVRVLRKDGVIAHSNFPGEIGQRVDKDVEHCSACHEADKVLKDIPNHKKWRIFETADRQQLLGNMEVIRNEPSCATAACHAHPATQSVLGVIDKRPAAGGFSLGQDDFAIIPYTAFRKQFGSERTARGPFGMPVSIVVLPKDGVSRADAMRVASDSATTGRTTSARSASPWR